MKRLDFVLPEWTRRVWVSEAARSVWEPKINEINGAWERIERWSVIDGARDSCLTFCDPTYLSEMFRWAWDHGIACVPVGATGFRDIYSASPAPIEPGKPVQIRVVLCKPERVDDWLEAWEPREGRTDNDRIGELLGFPACCRQFFSRYWIDESFVDTTWPYALGGSYALPNALEFYNQREVTLDGPIEANILLRWLGVRLVSHLPCSPTCGATVEMGNMFRHVAKSRHFETQLDDVETLLRMPLEWSALHGIATITTPIVTVSSRTDATAITYTVRRMPAGCDRDTEECYPAESAYGNRFPYRRRDLVPLTKRDHFADGIEGAVSGLLTRTNDKATQLAPGESPPDFEAEGDDLERRLAHIDNLEEAERTADASLDKLVRACGFDPAAVGESVTFEPASRTPDDDVTWVWKDNGFSSLESMNAAHEPIISATKELLECRGVSPHGYFLDLGAGNGELARKILALQQAEWAYVILVDDNRHVLDRNRCDPRRSVVREADMHTWEWLDGRGDRFSFALLMPGRLLEVNPLEREHFLVRLRALRCPIIVYGYSDWLERSAPEVSELKWTWNNLEGLINGAIGGGINNRDISWRPISAWYAQGERRLARSEAVAIELGPFPDSDETPTLDAHSPGVST